MKNRTTLRSIASRYCEIKHNSDNYSVGGGLDMFKFASNRHEDAQQDPGKLTLGDATQMFKKATGMDTDQVKAILNYAVPNMEWHHAGKLPKAYGGGMKKTYFLNAEQICMVAMNWHIYAKELELRRTEANIESKKKALLEAKKLEFLSAHATQVNRVLTRPEFFYQTAQEMQGKYGWFDSQYKSYNLPEYYSGWEFQSEAELFEFLRIG